MTFPSSRNTKDLCDKMRNLFVLFDTKMKQEGIDYIVTCTYRNNIDQNALYARGRTVPGHIITNARGGQSAHNSTLANGTPASEAFDIAIMVNGKIDWNVDNPAWKKAGMIGESVGLEWAGNWINFKEYPHFQLPRNES
jgi:peptidoglycan L-alanyl-D-glutamate endopeptidase CwlK